MTDPVAITHLDVVCPKATDFDRLRHQFTVEAASTVDVFGDRIPACSQCGETEPSVRRLFDGLGIVHVATR